MCIKFAKNLLTYYLKCNNMRIQGNIIAKIILKGDNQERRLPDV